MRVSARHGEWCAFACFQRENLHSSAAEKKKRDPQAGNCGVGGGVFLWFFCYCEGLRLALLCVCLVLLFSLASWKARSS